MSSAVKNKIQKKISGLSGAEKIHIGIVVSEWNPVITNALLEGSLEILLKSGIRKENIIVAKVPGSFEIPLGAQLLSNHKMVDAVICLGCIIKGETKHAGYISSAASTALMQLSIIHGKPFVFGILTTKNLLQAKERSGGKHGHKGKEAAITALKMISLKRQILKK